MLPKRLEAQIGRHHMNKVVDQAQRLELLECPAVSPQLIAHLKFKFQDPSKSAKPTNPQLAQLLTIQYGCDKVINYLNTQYDVQSAEARKEREI